MEIPHNIGVGVFLFLTQMTCVICHFLSPRVWFPTMESYIQYYFSAETLRVFQFSVNRQRQHEEGSYLHN